MAEVNTYDVGDEVQLECTFTDSGGTAQDPSTVVLKVKEPDGTVTTVATSNPSTGVFRGLFSPAKVGDHWYRFEGTGALNAAAEACFIVRAKRVG